MPGEVNTPISLILRLKHGGRDDWENFYAIYCPVIYRLCYARRLQHHDAQDIVGTVMQDLHRVICRGFQVDPQKGRFRAYLGRSVHRAITRLRRRGTPSGCSAIQADGLSDEAAPPDEEVAAMERIERLRLCIDRLRDSADVRRRDVEAFERYVLQSEDADRVAAYFGISTGRLYGIRCEMLARIRRMMIEFEQELGEL